MADDDAETQVYVAISEKKVLHLTVQLVQQDTHNRGPHIGGGGGGGKTDVLYTV